MSERQLATVRTIESVLPIVGADAVALALVDGWDVVIKKNEFVPGDQALYFEIDSFIPLSDPRFAFLTRGVRDFNGVHGVRIKTTKIRGQISQGLLIPLDNFPDIRQAMLDGQEDFTEMLGILKFEVDEGASVGSPSVQKGNFPVFIPRTDEKRVQNLSKKLSIHHGDLFEVTLKMDGSSMTVYRLTQEDGSSHFGVCSHNNEINPQDVIDGQFNAFLEVAIRDNLQEALALFDYNLALSGEILGPNIRKNREKFETYQFFVFNVYNIDKKEYLLPKERHAVIQKMLDAGFKVNHVPVLEPAHVLVESVSEILAMAIGDSLNHPIREGIVFKSLTDSFSFKAISNKFLLKYDDID